MATIGTTTTANQLIYPGNRRINRQALTGFLFYVSYSGTNIQLYKSTNNGTTWAAFGPARNVGVTIAEVGSVQIDSWNRIFIPLRANVTSQDRVYVQAAVLTNTNIYWHTLTQLAAVANGGVSGSAISGMSATTFRHKDLRTVGFVAAAVVSGANIGVTLYGFTIGALGQPSLNNGVILNFRTWYVAGSGRQTPASGLETGSGPGHAWVSFGRTHMYGVKLTWNGNGWTGPRAPIRLSSSTTTPPALDSVAAVWRYPGWCVAQPHPDDTTTVLMMERNQANTLTTNRTTPTHPTGVVRSCAIAFNQVSRDVRVWAVGTSTDVLYHIDYVQATSLWTAWTISVATPITGANNYSVRSDNYQSANYDVLTLSGAASPWTVTHTAQKQLYAPYAPAWDLTSSGYTNGGAADVDAALPLTWIFSDADAADTQSAWALSRQIGAGALAYFRASDSTWQPTEQKNVGASSTRTLAAAWGVDSDAAHTYKVKVWDSGDLASVYSAALVLVPSVKVNPSLIVAAAADIAPSLDTGFEIGTTGWTAVNGTLTRSTALAHTGTASGRLVTNAANNPKVTRVGNDPATAGVQYTLDGWLYAPATLGANQAFAALEWWNGTSYIIDTSAVVTMPVGVWTHVSIAGTCPAGATGVRRSFGIAGAAPAGLVLHVDDGQILAPTGGTVTTDTVIASWIVAESTAFRVTLSTNPGGEVVYDTGWWASTETDASHVISYRLANGTTWTVGLQTRNNEGLASTLQTGGFFVDYAEPPTPTCTLTPLPASGVIRVAIANPAPVGLQPAVSDQTLYRRRRLYTNLLPDPGFEIGSGGSGWFIGDATGVRSTAQVHSGTWAMFVTPNGTGTAPRADGAWVSLTGTMAGGGWIRPTNTNNDLQIGMHAFDAAGGYLTTRGQRKYSPAAGQWIYLETSVDFSDLPTAALCTVTLGLTNDAVTAPAAADTFYVDDAWVTPYDPNDGVEVAVGRLTGAGAQTIIVQDTFTRTVAAGSWGTPDVGAAWAVSGGPTTDFSVDGATGKQSLGSVATGRRAVTTGALDVDMVSSFVVPVVPAGAPVNVGLLARYTDTNNFYLGEAIVNPDLSVLARIRKSVAGSFTTVLTSAAIPGLTHAIARTYRLRFVVQGSSLRVRVWDNALLEPSVWHLDLVDLSLAPASSQIGFRTALDTGNTNTLPVVVSLDTLMVTGTAGGGSSAGTVDDWHPVSGVDYEYRALARGANGTSAYGPWTA